MKWYHFTVEYFEDLRNINHCEFLIMRKQDNGKYLLENNLRTWSDLRRERAIKDKDKDKEKDDFKLQRNKTFIVTRKWGGCPNGCNHSSHYSRREDLELLRQKDVEHGGPAPYGMSSAPGTPGGLVMADRRSKLQQTDGSVDEHHETVIQEVDTSTQGDDTASSAQFTPSSPDGTPSFISLDDRHRRMDSPHIHTGRDGGGTYSGRNSIAESDSDISDDGNLNLNQAAPPILHQKNHNTHVSGGDEKTDPLAYKDDENQTGEYRRSNRLGDASPDSSEEGDPEPHDEDLDKAEIEDRSIRGSIY